MLTLLSFVHLKVKKESFILIDCAWENIFGKYLALYNYKEQYLYLIFLLMGKTNFKLENQSMESHRISPR